MFAVPAPIPFFETISVEGLERAARFYAFFIEGVANAPRGEIDP